MKLPFSVGGMSNNYMGAKVIGVPAIPLPLYPELKLGLPGPGVSDELENFKPDSYMLLTLPCWDWVVFG